MEQPKDNGTEHHDRDHGPGREAAAGTAGDFAEHLKRLGYGPGSIRILPRLVMEFLERSGKMPAETGPRDIMDHYLHLQERPHRRRPGGLSGAYIAQHTYALRLFFAWQLQQGRTDTDPTGGLDFPRPDRTERKVPTREEVRQLHGAAEDHRERAVLAIFYGCGLRRSEGERLRTGDIHFATGLLHVREGKGGKRRAVPMGRNVAEDLRAYISGTAATGEGPLIRGRDGNGMKGGSMNRLVKGLAQRSGIKGDITLHVLRHAIATHLLEGGLSVEHVRDFLGHAHLESTQIYTHIGRDMLWDL